MDNARIISVFVILDFQVNNVKYNHVQLIVGPTVNVSKEVVNVEMDLQVLPVVLKCVPNNAIIMVYVMLEPVFVT